MKPVWQPIWQQVVSCKRGFSKISLATLPPAEMWSIAISLSVCLSVCLSVSVCALVAYLINDTSTHHMLPVSVARSCSADDNAIRYVLPVMIGWVVFVQLTAESPYTLQWAPLSPTIAPSHGDLDFRLTHGSLGPPESSTQTASRSVQPFLQGSLLWQADRLTDRQTTLLGR